MNLKLFLILLLLGSGAVPVFGDFPRHVDPELLAPDNPDPDLLFQMYSGIYGSIFQREYTKALGLIVTVDELYATPEAKNSMSNYNELLRHVISELNETELRLDNAINELLWLRETEAYNSLLEAATHLISVNNTVIDLGDESLDIARVLDGSPGELLAGKARIAESVDSLDQMIIESFLRVDQIISDKLAGLLETTVTASVNNTIPFPGEVVSVTGSLSTQVSGLQGKSIEVKLARSVLGNVETDADGGFSYLFRMPEYYVNSVTVQVSYWPTTEETSQFSPALTRLTLHPSFLTPSLELIVSETLFPGIQSPLTSKIEYIGVPLAGLSFAVNVFGRVYNSLSSEDGTAAIFVNVPANAPTGLHPITLVFQGKGIYGPTSSTRHLEVVRVEAYIELDGLGVHLSGRDAVISGDVKALAFPVQGSLVEVKLGGEILYAVSDEDGKFTTTFPIDLLTPSILQDFTVSATPEELWISKAYLGGSFLVLNSVSLLVFPGLIVVYLLTNKPRQQVEPPVLPVSPVASPFVYMETSGVAGVYLRAVNIMARITGRTFGSSVTIREYVDFVRPRVVGRLFVLFRRLSRLYEGWVYGLKTTSPPIRVSTYFLERMEEEDE